MPGITSHNLLCRLVAAGLVVGWLGGVSAAGEPRVDCHGDPLPPGAVARLGTVRLRGTGRGREPSGVRVAPIRVVKYSPDGRMVAVGDMDGAVQLWDARTGRRLRTLRGSRDEVTELAWSPDGRMVASACAIDRLHVWDPITGREGCTLDEPTSRTRRFAFAPGGRELAATEDDRGVCVYDSATGKTRRRIKLGGERLWAIAYAADGKSLLAAGSAGAQVWWLDSATGAVTPAEGQTAHGVLGGAGGRVLISWFCVRDKGTDLAVWNYSTWEVVHRVRIDLDWAAKWGERLTCSPDGRTLATAGPDRHIRLWDLDSGKEMLRVRTPGEVEAVDFAPDGKRIVSGQADGTVLVWDLRECALAEVRRRTEGTADVKKLWAALGGDDPGRAYRAMWQLVSEPGPAVALLKERVRVVAGPGGRRVRNLLADLDDNSFRVREAAQWELRRLGTQVEPDLRRLLASKPPLEVRRRAERLLRGFLRTPVPLTADERGPVRAVGVLERIGTPAARRVLEALARGAAGVRQTREAKEALARLGKGG